MYDNLKIGNFVTENWLDKNERLELLVQDNLTGLTGFRMVAQGHIVE